MGTFSLKQLLLYKTKRPQVCVRYAHRPGGDVIVVKADYVIKVKRMRTYPYLYCSQDTCVIVNVLQDCAEFCDDAIIYTLCTK